MKDFELYNAWGIKRRDRLGRDRLSKWRCAIATHEESPPDSLKSVASSSAHYLSILQMLALGALGAGSISLVCSTTPRMWPNSPAFFLASADGQVIEVPKFDTSSENFTSTMNTRAPRDRLRTKNAAPVPAQESAPSSTATVELKPDLPSVVRPMPPSAVRAE